MAVQVFGEGPSTSEGIILNGVRVLHRAYKLLLSGILGNCCRFHPTCSDYALEAVRTHGPLRGALLTIWRVLRCQPFAAGGIDPVPPVSRHYR